MEEHQGRRPRRLRAQRPPVLPAGRESAESVLPDVPRVGALDALLREVDSLRLTLETDLTLAAAAVEHGSPQVAIDIIDSDRDGLRGFESRALEHVADLARPKRRLRVPAAPFIAAAAVAGFVLGVVPHTTTPTQTDTTNASSDSATESLNQLTTAASNGETGAAILAANRMHAQLLAVIARAKTDPLAAREALELLRAEQFVLSNAGTDSAALTQALAASRQLSSRILLVLTTATASPHGSTPPIVFTPPSPRQTTSPKPATAPTPKPATTTSPKAQPSSSPSPSGSPSGGLPNPPGFS